MKEYATVVQDDGENYREIADIMTEIGYPMNHSSARNYVLRAMRKFAAAMAKAYGGSLDPKTIDEIAKSPAFQDIIADTLHVIERHRKMKDVTVSA